MYQHVKEQWKTVKAYISTKSEVLRDEQGLYKLKDDMYTNSQMKDKVLGEYKRGGSEKQKGAVQYNKVHTIFMYFTLAHYRGPLD